MLGKSRQQNTIEYIPQFLVIDLKITKDIENVKRILLKSSLKVEKSYGV